MFWKKFVINVVVIVLVTWLLKSCVQEKPSPGCRFLNEISVLIKTNSIFNDSLNWKQIDSVTIQTCQNAYPDLSIQEAGKFFIKELRKVGDKHSFIMSAKNVNDYSSDRYSDLMPSGILIQDHIGFLRVPAFGSVNVDVSRRYATILQNIIRNYDQSHHIKGWIIDLSTNGGGNMYPMIAGLGPLIGEGKAGAFVNSKNETFEWIYQAGGFGPVKVEDPYNLKAPNAPLAILTSNKTASSGEMTLIAFLGKPNVRTFGAPTGNFTTSNVRFPLSDASSLVLATAMVLDRKGRKYHDSIRPDVPAIINTLSATDDSIKEAIRWINEYPILNK